MDVAPTELACNFLQHGHKDFAPMEYVIFVTFALCSIQKSVQAADPSTARDTQRTQRRATLLNRLAVPSTYAISFATPGFGNVLIKSRISITPQVLWNQRR